MEKVTSLWKKSTNTYATKIKVAGRALVEVLTVKKIKGYSVLL